MGPPTGPDLRLSPASEGRLPAGSTQALAVACKASAQRRTPCSPPSCSTRSVDTGPEWPFPHWLCHSHRLPASPLPAVSPPGLTVVCAGPLLAWSRPLGRRGGLVHSLGRESAERGRRAHWGRAGAGDVTPRHTVRAEVRVRAVKAAAPWAQVPGARRWCPTGGCPPLGGHPCAGHPVTGSAGALRGAGTRPPPPPSSRRHRGPSGQGQT